MYLVPLKTALVEALQATFDSEYPEEDFRNTPTNKKLHISIEYPHKRAHYPGLWVDYDDTQDLTIAGIGHFESVLDDDELPHEVTRWEFGGTVTITCVALSSLERDRLYDEMVRVFVSSRTNSILDDFREKIENNDLIAMNADFDDLRPSGNSSGPGTPWGSEEVIYERSLSFSLIGEFLSDPESAVLIPIGEVRIHGYVEDVEPVPDPPVDAGYSATEWH